MKKVFFLLLYVLLFSEVTGQMNFNDSLAQSRNHLTQDAMIVLGSWAIANISAGFIMAAQTTGEQKYFWNMNAYWNFINLGLATLGYINARKAALKHFGFTDNYVAQQSMEKLYLFNLGLDLAYIAGGFYLDAKGQTQSDVTSKDQLSGYGKSIVFQGGFLLVMDAIMYSLHHANTRKMNQKLRHLELNASPGGLGLSYSF